MAIRTFRRLLLISIHLLSIPSALAQKVDETSYVVERFGMEQGLPQSSVNDIIQTRDGYIWLATYGGLVRFDGLSFTTFNRSNTPGMISERILKLYEGADNDIWIFPETVHDKVLWFKEGEVQTFTLDRSNGPNFRMFRDDKSGFWMTDFTDLFKHDGNEFIQVPIHPTKKDPNDTLYKEGLWVTIGDRVVVINDDTATEVFNLNERVPGGVFDFQELVKGSGELIISTLKDGIFRFSDDKISEIKRHESLLNSIFNDFGESNTVNRTLFVEFLGLMAIWDGNELKPFDPISSSEAIFYKSVLEDSEGNIWLGTDAKGLYKVRPSAIQMIDRDHGLDNEKMLSLTMLNDGGALFSTNCGGLFEWKEGKAVRPKVQDFFKSGCNWSIFQDSKDRIWIGGGGVYVTNSLQEEGEYFGEEQGFTNASVHAMMEDRNENIWIATSIGVYVYDGQGFSKKYTTEDGLYYNDARALFEDSKGTIWLGTATGLNRIKDNVVKKVLLNKNTQNSPSITQPIVRAIYEGADGEIWIGSYGDGLYRIKDAKVDRITTDDGLFDNIISQIVEDDLGYLWMGSNRGISRVKRNDLNVYLDEKIGNLAVDSFGANDGMNSPETNGGFQPSAVKGVDGRIYFPTIEGVAVVDPKKISKNLAPPPVYIERIQTENEDLRRIDTLTLSYGSTFLEVNYTGINFTDPEGIEFKYRLVGLDDHWIEVGKLRTAIYTKIPPGEFTFEVIAANSSGVWNNEGASFEITVIPPFWQTTWFYVLCTVFVGLIIGSIYLRRVQQLKRENEKQRRFSEQLIRSEEQERRRIANELHDSLGQQILVIKNRAELAKSYLENPLALQEQLNDIVDSAQNSISDVRTISHGLRPVHLERFGLTDALLNLCEEVKQTSGIEWLIDIENIDDCIDSENEINFYRVIQEAINNIIKHSLATKAEIHIEIDNSEITTTISDNGKGFDPEVKKNTGGLGLTGMSERVESLGGKFNTRTKNHIGTTLTFKVPINSWVEK